MYDFFNNQQGPVAMCVLYFSEYFIRLEELLNKGCSGSANQQVRRGSEDCKKHNTQKNNKNPRVISLVTSINAVPYTLKMYK